MKIKTVSWHRLIDENILTDNKARTGYNRALSICQDSLTPANTNCLGVGGGGISPLSKCWQPTVYQYLIYNIIPPIIMPHLNFISSKGHLH